MRHLHFIDVSQSGEVSIPQVKDNKDCPRSWASRPCFSCKSVWCPPWPPKSQGASTRPEKRASQGGDLPKPCKTRESGASAHVVASCFSHAWVTQTDIPFNQTTLEELSPRPLCLASFITELCDLGAHILDRHPKKELDLCDGFVDLHGRGQGLAAEWVDGSARRTQENGNKLRHAAENSKLTTGWHGCFVLRTFPPAIPSSDSTKQTHKSPNWSEVLKKQNWNQSLMPGRCQSVSIPHGLLKQVKSLKVKRKS